MIVVFGSVGVDVVTRVAQFPRPGETIACDDYDVVPGTKGANQALAARRAGARVVHVATRGDDAFGRLACSLLDAAGVDTTRIAVSGRPTGTCLIAVNEAGENTIVAAAGANRDTTLAALEACPFGPGDTLVLQREIRDDATFAAIRLGRSRGARVVLNVAPAAPLPAELLALCDLLVLNETEATVVGEALGIASDDPAATGEALCAAHGTAVAVTLGAAGAVLFSRAGTHRAAALAIDARDTTAAGDSFVGFLAAALDAGTDLATALRRGTAAGSLCCTGDGAQPSIPTAAAVTAALDATRA